MRESKEFNEPKKPSHISYKQYQKKVTKNPNEGLMIFVSAFFIMLLLFLAIAKQISPDIDVAIGDENSVSADSNGVDDRLKNIKSEDGDSPMAVEDDIFTPELDEKISVPTDLKTQKEQEKEETKIKELEKEKQLQKDKEKEKEELKLKEEAKKKEELKKKEAEAKQAAAKQMTAPVVKAETAAPTVEQPKVNAKVVVGYYSTEAQAQVAKGIIADSGLNITPFVKNIGGAYTIQVGSYSTREKAQSITNELLRNNFPARIIME